MIHFLITMIIVIIATIVIIRTGNVAYQNWLTEVKRLAPYYGFDEESFAAIDEEIWTAYYDWHLEPEAAIKKYLSEY